MSGRFGNGLLYFCWILYFSFLYSCRLTYRFNNALFKARKTRERKKEKERAGFKEWLEKANKAEKHNAIVEAKGTIPDPWILYNENFKKFLDLSKTKYEIDYRYVINNFEKTLEKEQVIIILEDYEVVVAAFDKWLNLKAEKEMEEFQKKVDRKLQFIKLNEVKHGTTT